MKSKLDCVTLHTLWYHVTWAPACWDMNSVCHLSQCCRLCDHSLSSSGFQFEGYHLLLLNMIICLFQRLRHTGVCKEDIISQCLEIRCHHHRVSGCLSLSVLWCYWCNKSRVPFYYSVIRRPQQCSVSMLVCCAVAALVAGADLPQGELYGTGSCVTLSDWWLPYLVQSAAQVPGVRTCLGRLSMALKQWMIEWDQCDVSASCDFTFKHSRRNNRKI